MKTEYFNYTDENGHSYDDEEIHAYYRLMYYCFIIVAFCVPILLLDFSMNKSHFLPKWVIIIALLGLVACFAAMAFDKFKSWSLGGGITVNVVINFRRVDLPTLPLSPPNSDATP